MVLLRKQLIHTLLILTLSFFEFLWILILILLSSSRLRGLGSCRRWLLDTISIDSTIRLTRNLIWLNETNFILGLIHCKKLGMRLCFILQFLSSWCLGLWAAYIVIGSSALSLSLFFLSHLVSFRILSNYFRCKCLVRFESSAINILKLFEVLCPLIFHLSLEILANLKICGIGLKCFFDEYLVDILKM